MVRKVDFLEQSLDQAKKIITENDEVRGKLEATVKIYERSFPAAVENDYPDFR